ncbi:MAG: (d)CMP kinase [Verrucomicrobia bacterium]|nr:(d)CMP kinase [Verrucomicrobiota bacterium]
MSVIAIDGPAASGKSSVSRRLAKRLGFVYVNSGTMYRAITWEVLRQGVDTTSPAAVAAALDGADIHCGIGDNSESFIHINSAAPDAALRDSRVNLHVSLISAVPAVRELISARLRLLAGDRNVVMEGRDIGSAVFPETPFKFYLDASPEIRRKRRADEGQSDAIEARDKMDSSRKAAPLKIAGDARVVDTSHLTLEGVVEAILDILRQLGITPR